MGLCFFGSAGLDAALQAPAMKLPHPNLRKSSRASVAAGIVVVGRVAVPTVAAPCHSIRPGRLACAAADCSYCTDCGYCTTGSLTTAQPFLANGAKPTDDRIRNLLAGHLCRCGANRGIIKASGRCGNLPAREATL